jgi:hypothetical protein
MYPYIVQGNNITVVIDSAPHTISKTHITYPQVLEAIKAGDWERVKEIVDPVKTVLKFGQGNVSIDGDKLFWKDRELHNSLSVRMIAMLQEGFTIDPMVNFMDNLMQNPSKRSIDELYGFLEKNNLPITPDGHFLAYKRVRDDYTDCHSGTMDNSIGKIVEMPRNEVDDERDRTCSTGLHFCSHSYLKHFGGDRIVIVKINPADVVSIPSDYDDAKGRACRYEVISEIANDVADGVEFTKPVQRNAWSAMEDDTDWEMMGGDDDCNEDYVPDEDEVDYGDSLFHRGYDDGYHSQSFAVDSDSFDDAMSYADGYKQGKKDSNFGEAQRFAYSDF